MIVVMLVVAVFVFVIVRMRMIIWVTAVTVFENLHKLRTIFFTKSDRKIEVQKIRRPASD